MERRPQHNDNNNVQETQSPRKSYEINWQTTYRLERLTTNGIDVKICRKTLSSNHDKIKDHTHRISSETFPLKCVMHMQRIISTNSVQNCQKPENNGSEWDESPWQKMPLLLKYDSAKGVEGYKCIYLHIYIYVCVYENNQIKEILKEGKKIDFYHVFRTYNNWKWTLSQGLFL